MVKLITNSAGTRFLLRRILGLSLKTELYSSRYKGKCNILGFVAPLNSEMKTCWGKGQLMRVGLSLGLSLERK